MYLSSNSSTIVLPILAVNSQHIPITSSHHKESNAVLNFHSHQESNVSPSSETTNPKFTAGDPEAGGARVKTLLDDNQQVQFDNREDYVPSEFLTEVIQESYSVMINDGNELQVKGSDPSSSHLSIGKCFKKHSL